MAREAMDVCLRVPKESNKSRCDSHSIRNSVLIISHITFRDCRMHIFSDNLSRNSCISEAKSPTLYRICIYFYVNSSSLFCIYKCTFVFRAIDNMSDFPVIVITLVSKASKISLFGDF